MRLFLLGQPYLEANGRKVVLSKIHSQILAWLTLHQKEGIPMPRVRLARAIWADFSDDQGRRRLANNLYRLRQEIPDLEIYFFGDATNLELQPIWTDVYEFKNLMQSQNPTDWLNALEMYRGDLLEGEDIPWLETWRSELHQTMLQGLRQAIGKADTHQAIALSQRLIHLEPWNEDAHTQLIRLYANNQQLPEAIAVYQKLASTLEQEFSSRAKPETQVFIKDLERQLEQQNNKAHQVMVGRNQEWQSLTNALNAVRVGQGNIILLEGEPGLGKTRLLLELKSLATWHQVPVLYGAAANSTPAYAPLEQALRGAVVLLEQATPLIQKNLEPLLKTTSESEAQPNPQVVSAALERWLRHLEQPTIWLLDDLHWAGDLFWNVLKMLVRVSQQRPVLLVLSARSQELKDNKKATETITEIRQNQQILHFALDGLSLEECTQLARGQGKKMSSKELEQMHRISAGNPLVFQELVLGNKADKHLGDAFQSRFAKLDNSAREALEAASVLGKHLDLRTWEAMLGVPPPIAQLLETRFLHSEPELGFQHDLTRAFVYEKMRLETRQKWHGMAFEILKAQDTRAAVLAHHAQEAGFLAHSVPFLRKAAFEAFNLCSFQEAYHYINQAQKNNQVQDFNRLESAHLKLLQLYLSQTESPGNQSIDEIDAIEIAAQHEQDLDLKFQAMKFKIRVLGDKGEKQLMCRAAEELIKFTEESKNISYEINALITITTQFARSFIDLEIALGYAKTAYDLSKKINISEQLRFNLLIAYMNAQIRSEKYDLAWEILAETEDLFDKNPRLIAGAVQLYNIKGALAHMGEEFELAYRVFYQQLEVAYTLGSGKSIDTTLANLAESLKMLGRFEEALIWCEELAGRAPKPRDQLTPSQVAYFYSDLAEVLTYLGRIAEAEEIVMPLEKWLDQKAVSQTMQKVIRVMTLIYRAQGLYLQGFELLKKFHNAFDPRIVAEFASLSGFKQQAEQWLEQAFAKKNNFANNCARMRLYFTSYFIQQNPTDLETARLSLLRFATQIETLENRQIMLKNVYYAKAIEAAWQQQSLETTVVELPALSGEGVIQVTWTLDSGASDKAHLEQHGKVALRNHRLKRLMLEAQAQGAKALKPQLATVLGVTVRTIEMDMANLKNEMTKPV